MANPVYQSYTTTGAKTPVALDYYQTPFSASMFVALVDDATAAFSVEFTADDFTDPNVTPRWFPDANAPADTAASVTTPYTFPIRGIRINITAITGTVEFKVLQGT
jgi:hypothetical protein